jgi:NUMOD4 motif
VQQSFTFPEPGETERWLPVVGWEGLYDVSDLGHIWSVPRPDNLGRPVPGRILKQTPSGKYGYLYVKLCRGGTGISRAVHALVAEAFLPPCMPGQQIRHGPNGNQDNRASQLCYGTPAENCADTIRDGNTNHGIRNPHHKLTEAEAADICRRVAEGETQRSAGARYGVTQPNVSMLIRGLTWKQTEGLRRTAGRRKKAA